MLTIKFFPLIVNRTTLVFFELNRKEQYDFVITNTIPTYVHFFASWKKYGCHLTKSPLWISYEKFFANKEQGFHKVLDHCSLLIDEQKIKRSCFT